MNVYFIFKVEVETNKKNHAIIIFLLTEPGLLHAPPVRGVDDVDKTVGLVEIVPPVGADGLLPSNVPHIELEGIVLQRFDVEPLGRHDVADVLLAARLIGLLFSSVFWN
jgi:hypothetical protein